MVIQCIFSYCSGKQDLTFHANGLHWRQFAKKCQNPFSGKNKRIISTCLLLKILPGMLSINDYKYTFRGSNCYNIFVFFAKRIFS